MASTVELARQHQRAQQSLVRRLLGGWLRLSSGLDPADVVGSWRAGVGPSLLAATTAVQRQAATAGGAYVEQVIAASGATSAPVGTLIPEALAGVASDGRPLGSLLEFPVLRTARQIGDGASADDAVAQLVRQLAMIAGTQAADAGRVGTGVAMTANRAITGYVRVVHLPACSRCIVLAGRVYSWSAGFLRHPRCDCTHEPVTSTDHARSAGTSPSRLFDRLTRAEQDRIFGAAAARAIRDGADLAQVVNARRGITSAGSGFTVEGVTRRGYAGRRLRELDGAARRAPVARMTPEAIYQAAGDDRDEALRLLYRHGYLTASAPSQPTPRPRVTLSDRTSPGRPLDGPSGHRHDQPPAGPGGNGGHSGSPPDGLGRLDPPDEQPLLGDLLPHDQDDADERRGDIEHAIAEQIGGEYRTRDGTVFTVYVNEVDVEPHEIVARSTVRVDGLKVGEINREFYRERDGTLWVDHAWLRLDKDVQGRGFAPVFNGHMERWYRRSGVDRIEIIAGLDKGGYTWASQGFEFLDEDEARSILERLELRVDPLRDWLDEHENDDGLSDAEYEEIEDLVEAADELMDRAEREPFGSDDYPTAFEISQLGRKPGQGKDDMWLGKQAMMGSEWRGVRFL
ncbi:hypothetical protein [Actinomadura gamaensis]|uniref:Capsid maturation protease n=1 Tax=Actinomadura gamaensis TaxID=1763541 RepID=A0ABV9U885_9ACTN